MFKRSLVYIMLGCVALALLLAACNQPSVTPAEPPNPESSQPAPVTPQYMATVPGTTFLWPIGNYRRSYEPLDTEVKLHIEAFYLKDGKATGEAIGTNLTVEDGSIWLHEGFYSQEYRTWWNLRDYDFPEGTMLRLEVRLDRAKAAVPACNETQANLANGCLGFVDLAVYPKQWYARVLTAFPQALAGEEGEEIKAQGAIEALQVEAHKRAAPLAQQDNISLESLADDLKSQGFFFDDRPGKSIILWGQFLNIRFHVKPNAANLAPELTLIAPKTIAQFTSNEHVILQARAQDVEDGDLSASISWTSSIDGALGTGERLAKKLSKGKHTINVSVEDSQGKSSQQSFSLEIVDASSLGSLPEGWTSTIILANQDTGTGISSYDSNSKQFTLRGYASDIFVGKQSNATNAQARACFDTRALNQNSRVGLVLSQGINAEGLIAPWIKILVGAEGKAQVSSSDSNVTATGNLEAPNCFLIRKVGNAISIYESAGRETKNLEAQGAALPEIPKDFKLVGKFENLNLDKPYYFSSEHKNPEQEDGTNSQTKVELEIEDLPEQTDPEDDPRTETVQATIDFDVDSALAQSEFIFDASASRGTGLKYQWNLGDGKTSDKAVVYHVYDKPGKYDVSLQITNSVGRQNQLKQTVYIFPTVEGFIPALSDYRSIKFDPTQGGRNVTFNLGELFEGFRYEVDLGHNNQKVTRRKGEEATIKHTYPLGTYTYTVKIYDEREDKNANARAGVFGPQQLANDQPVVEESTWFTLWSDAPSAKFSMSNPNDKTEIGADGKSGESDENGDFYGNLPLSIDFDASGTQAAKNNRNAELVYSWDFGDGSPSEEGKDKKTTKHTYTKEGLHLVTLTVKDPDTNLTDSYQAFVKAKYPGHDALVSLVYPEAELRTTALSLLDQAHFAVDDGLALQADVPILKDKFPYVMVFDEAKHKEKIRFSIKQDHNDFFCDPVANNYVYDKYYDATLNNGEKNIPIGNAFYRAKVNLYNDNVPSQGGLCDVWLSKPNLLKGLIRAANNTLGIRTSRQDLRTEIDTIASLRVPRVYVAILPDSMIAGNLPSPNIVEKRANTISDNLCNKLSRKDGVETATNSDENGIKSERLYEVCFRNWYNNKVTGEEELILMVQVRESDVDQLKRKVTFDVPAYGVDEKGRKVNANGYFNARFAGEDSDCGDCVMVDGRTTISLTVPLPSQKKPKATFKLDKVVVSRDGSCTSDSYSDLNMFVSRCISINTSYRVPENAPSNITAFDYPIAITPAASAGSNQITILSDLPNPLNFMRDTVQSTWNWFNDLSFRDVGIFVYNLIPFVSDGVDLLNQLRITYLTDKEADIVITTFASVGLVLDATTGGLLDVTAFFKASYKVSLRIARRQGGGSLAKIFKDEIINLLAGSMSPLDLITSMKNTFGQVVTVGKACGLTGAVRCFGQLDISVTQLAGLDNVNFKVAADRFDDGLQAAKRGDLDVSCFLGVAELVTSAYNPTNMLMWIFGIDINATGTSNLTLQAAPTAGNGYCLKKNSTYRRDSFERYDAEFKRKNIPDSERTHLQVHHIVPAKDNRSDHCTVVSRGTTCSVSRQILITFEININDPANLVPLPMPKRLRENKLPGFKAAYPNALPHNQVTTGRGPHSKDTYRKVYDGLLNLERTAKDQASAANVTLTSNTPEAIAIRNSYRRRIQFYLAGIGASMLNGQYP